MTRKAAKEVNKPAGVASADLEENGVPVSEKGAENFSAASSKHRGEMATPADTNAKPTSAAGGATNGASVSNEVADSRDSRLDRLERSLDLDIKRRELIKPALNSEFKRICSATTPITDNLFGDNLPQQVKDIVETNCLKHKLAPSARAPPRAGARRGVSPCGRGSFRDFRGSWRGGGGLARLPRFAGNYGFSRPSQDYWNQKSSFASTSKSGESVHQHNKNSKV